MIFVSKQDQKNNEATERIVDPCNDSNEWPAPESLFRNVSVIPLGEDAERDRKIRDGWQQTKAP